MVYCGVVAAPLDGVIDPLELVVVCDRRIFRPCLAVVVVLDDDMVSPPLEGDMVLPVEGDDIVSLGIAPVPLPVLVAPGDIEPVDDPVEPVPPVEPLDPAICALAVVASMVAAMINKVFIRILLRKFQRGGIVDVFVDVPKGEVGVVARGDRVPTRPSPMVPVVDDPMGGVTPVAGCGSAGTTGLPGFVAEPRPEGDVPGGGIPPAGA